MSEADRLNDLLSREAPAFARCLSALGRRAAFPRGIPFQSAAARDTRYNATIGQVTDGRGRPMPVRPLDDHLSTAVSRRMAFLYSPQSGHPALRDAWKARQAAHAHGPTTATSRPYVTAGLTQGLSHVAEMFCDPGTPVIFPEPHWENYDLLFTFRVGAQLRGYPVFDEAGAFSLEGLDAALSALAAENTHGVLVLNHPHNPTGYTPTAEQAAALVQRVADHPGPLVVVVDDAYQGLVYTDDAIRRSLAWDLWQATDPERHAVLRLDGATKELLFFPGRVGFLTTALTGEAEAAFESKLKTLGRSSVSTPTGPSQALLLAALGDDRLEHAIADKVAVLRRRWERLTDALATHTHPALRPLPFNSGVFALLQLGPELEADAFRQALIEEEGVGTIALPESNALRVAYCSLHEDDVEPLVERMARAAARHAG